MSTDLRELYQEVILDHNRRPRNFRVLEDGLTGEGFNPLCGDRLTVYVHLDGDVVTEAAFQGSGCAISKASASLMTEAVTGKSIGEVLTLFDRVQSMITSPDDGTVEPLGKLAALAGVRQFPVRVKCAALAWHALRAALESRHEVVTTE